MGRDYARKLMMAMAGTVPMGSCLEGVPLAGRRRQPADHSENLERDNAGIGPYGVSFPRPSNQLPPIHSRTSSFCVRSFRRSSAGSCFEDDGQDDGKAGNNSLDVPRME